jgi:hypothetical protein
MYLDGLKLERILGTSDEMQDGPPSAASPPKPGEMTQIGPQNVDLSRTAHRVVSVPKVNWGPPE